jgi:hypothetical protein
MSKTMPEVRRAVLMCNDRCHVPTLHTYVGFKLANDGAAPAAMWWRLIYSCVTCGSERVWGTSAEQPVDPRASAMASA